MNTITFRNATIDDLPLLIHWDEQPHVVNSDPESDWDWEQDLLHESPFSEKLIAMLGNEPIGFVQIIDPANEETHYWGDVEQNMRAIDIWIGEAENLNKGYGTQMMNLAIARCFSEEEITAIIIDPLTSNKDAIRFYKRFGFSFVEYRTFGPDECSVLRLDRSDWMG